MKLFLLLMVVHHAVGCTLVNNEEADNMTGFLGKSVLLPCYCAYSEDEPTSPKWSFWSEADPASHWREILPKAQATHYKGRVQLSNYQGNLSLHISDLTEEDQGVYMCSLSHLNYKYIRLTVRSDPRSSSSSVLPGNDCTLKENEQTDYITVHAGDSVLLPCYCTDLHTTPEALTWKKDIINGQTWKAIPIESGQYRNRVQLFNAQSPGNLSLLISHLTEEDGGDYMCYLKKTQYRYMRLTVINDVSGSVTYFPFAAVTAVILHIIVIVYFIKKSRVSEPARVYYSEANEDGMVTLQQ